MPVSFSQKPKEATKPSNKEINSVVLDDERPESSTRSVFSVVTWNDTTKKTSCFGCRKNIRTFQFQPQIDLYEESRGLVVIGKAQRLMHKDSSGALQYTPNLQIIYFHVNERCCRIFSCSVRMLQMGHQDEHFLSQSQTDFLYSSITLNSSQNTEYYWLFLVWINRSEYEIYNMNMKYVTWIWNI